MNNVRQYFFEYTVLKTWIFKILEAEIIVIIDVYFISFYVNKDRKLIIGGGCLKLAIKWNKYANKLKIRRWIIFTLVFKKIRNRTAIE